jgi:hypothetical protein
MDTGAKRTSAALIVILMGAALFTFGSFGARHKLPGSRAFQAVGVAAIMLALLALFTIHGG